MLQLQILFSLLFFYSCGARNEEVKNTAGGDSIEVFNLTENQKKVLDGAKKCLEAGFKYDVEMAYHVLKYKDGKYAGAKVYPGGDLDPGLGVCTDVTIRALRWGGICDLQEVIYEDLRTNWKDYPMRRWNAKKPDPNIDHRRVPNQLVWFKKNWEEVSDNSYQPGDIVIWDMDGDSWADHLGIVSDKFSRGEPYLIHNFPDPGYVAEEKVLRSWEIAGVFRVK